MRHYLLFAGPFHYPDGGFDDLIDQKWASMDGEDAVVNRMRDEGRKYDWWELCVIGTFGMELFESGNKYDESGEDDEYTFD